LSSSKKKKEDKKNMGGKHSRSRPSPPPPIPQYNFDAAVTKIATNMMNPPDHLSDLNMAKARAEQRILRFYNDYNKYSTNMAPFQNIPNREYVPPTS
jgi:hypothetical protein